MTRSFRAGAAKGIDVTTHRDGRAAQYVPVLPRYILRHAGQDHHGHHVLALLEMREDLDDRESDPDAAPCVIDSGAVLREKPPDARQ